jgi:predicted hydrocarbon binding protein
MHGMVHAELKLYVEGRHGELMWLKLLDQTGLGTAVHLPIGRYPDGHVHAIVAALAHATGKPVQAILEDFGEFIARDLIGLYGALIKPEWRTLDLLFNTERTIHKVVRLQNPEAEPPFLTVTRPAPDQVIVTYTSPRRLCAFARGIVTGIANHFGEEVTIADTTCMLRGDAVCALTVREVHPTPH